MLAFIVRRIIATIPVMAFNETICCSLPSLLVCVATSGANVTIRDVFTRH